MERGKYLLVRLKLNIKFQSVRKIAGDLGGLTAINY